MPGKNRSFMPPTFARLAITPPLLGGVIANCAGGENRRQTLSSRHTACGVAIAKSFLPGLASVPASIRHICQPFDSPRKSKQILLLHPYKKHPKRVLFVRVGRIELPSSAWKADVLPLNDTRNGITITKFKRNSIFLALNLSLL